MPRVLPSTYFDLLDQCLKYVLLHYSYCVRIIIVFDGYEDELSTKSQAHSNRSAKGTVAPDVHINVVSMQVASQKNEFLRNTTNKKQLITLLSKKFRDNGIDVRQSEGDANTLIVKTAKLCAEDGSSIVVISEILVILLHHWRPETGEIFFCCKRQGVIKEAKPTQKSDQKVEIEVRTKKPVPMWWSIRNIAEATGDRFILFAHFLGAIPHLQCMGKVKY